MISTDEPDDAKERLLQELPLLGDKKQDVLDLLNRASEKYPESESEFSHVKTYCMFIGYPRSGHSIIGSLLDAHEKMIIAHELNALRFIQAGCNYQQLYWLLKFNSELFTKHGRIWGKYSYDVPGKWHGKFSELNVIGDKKGGTSTMIIGRNPGLLEKLQQTIPHPVRFLHITRNPFDNIATMFRKDIHDLNTSINFYLQQCQVNKAIIEKVGMQSALTIRHEDLIETPQDTLKKISGFLNVGADDQWLSACTSIIATKPSQSRKQINWSLATRENIASIIKRFDFLESYSFDK